MGREITHQPEDHMDDVVAWVSEGKTLREFCRQPGRPSYSTVYTWINNNPAFAQRFARARDEGYDQIAEEALRIADTPQIGVITTEDDGEKGGTKTTREDMLGHRKLQVETRLKLLAKWRPQKYGDKIAIGGAEDLGPLRTLTRAERAARVSAMLAVVARPALPEATQEQLKELLE